MKHKNTVIVTCMCALMLLNPMTAWAAPIDNVEVYNPAGESDEIVFVAGEHQGSQSGEGTTDTQTEEERNIASQNASIAKEQQRLMQTFVKNTVEGSMAVYTPGASIVIREDIPISKQDLLSFITKGLRFEGVPGLYAIPHQVSSAASSDNTKAATDDLKDNLLGSTPATGSLPFILDGELLSWDWIQKVDTTGWPSELIEAWKEILRNHTWTQIRTDLVGGGMIDWPYQELRYEVLKAYVTSLAMSDLIETTNITEYRVSKEEKQKIISKQPVSEYQWEICDADGNVLKTTHTYGRTLRLSFSRAGTYYIRAYQKHYVTRADVVSTQKLEYWMISETKQLLWSSEMEGQQFYYDRNVSEEFIATNYIQQEITASMLIDNWIFQLDPSGQLQITEGFQIERIK